LWLWTASLNFVLSLLNIAGMAVNTHFKELFCMRCTTSGHLSRDCQLLPFLKRKTEFELRMERARSWVAHNARSTRKARKTAEMKAAQDRKLKRTTFARWREKMARFVKERRVAELSRTIPSRYSSTSANLVDLLDPVDLRRSEQKIFPKGVRPRGMVDVHVRGCFDSDPVAELRLDAGCCVLEIKHLLQAHARIPVRFQTLLHEDSVVPLNDLATLHEAGFRSHEVLLLIKQKPKNAARELQELITSRTLSPVELETEVTFLLSYLSACCLAPWQVQHMFEVAIRHGDLSLARLLLEQGHADPNVEVILDRGIECCGMGCCFPHRTLLELCADHGQKRSCLLMLDSGRLTMASCSSIEKASQAFDSPRARQTYLQHNRLYHMIQKEGWDATYPLCQAYVEKANNMAWARGCHVGWEDKNPESTEEMPEELPTSERRREKRPIAGRGRLQKLQERRRWQQKTVKLKNEQERYVQCVQRLKQRSYKAWSQANWYASYG